MNPLVDPCELCLVRTMCRMICDDLLDYITEVVKRVVADPNDKILDQFNPNQQKLINNAATTFRKNHAKLKGPNDGDQKKT